MAKCTKLQVAQFLGANFEENATYIANNFDAKKYGEIVFLNKPLICLSCEKVAHKHFDEIDAGAVFRCTQLNCQYFLLRPQTELSFTIIHAVWAIN